MAKAKLHCDIAHPNKKGLCNIRIRLFHQNKARFIQTQYYINKNDWDADELRIKSSCKSVLSVKAANIKLDNDISFVRLIISELRNIHSLTADELKIIIENKVNGDYLSQNTFSDYYKKQIELMKHRPGGTHEIYQDTLNRINKYTNEENLHFETITKEWLEKINAWMEKELNTSPSTRSLDFRNIRAIFNKALDEPVPIISDNLYPFGRRGFKIPKGTTRHRDLSRKQFRAIFNYNAKQGSRAELGRDSFILSFLLVGINNSDLYNLRTTDISNNDRLSYKRRKTKRDYNINIHPYAMELIRKHKGDDDRLLCYASRYVDTRGMAKGVNKGLREIADELGIKELTMYYARHSWATFAGEIDIPMKTIASALGHGRNTTTDIYVNFNAKKVDKANKKVIAYTGIFEPEKLKKKKNKAKKVKTEAVEDKSLSNG